MTTKFDSEQADKQRRYEGVDSLNDGMKYNVTSVSGNHQGLPKPGLPKAVFNQGQAEPPSRSTRHQPDKSRPRWWRRLSLRTKATTLAIALSTIPILALGATAYYLTNKNITRSITQQQQATTISLANKLDRFIGGRYRDIQTLAGLSLLNNPQVRAFTSNREKQALLDQYIKNNEGYDSIAVIDLDGKVMWQSSGQVITDYSKIDYFQEVIRTNRPVITPPRKSLATSDYSIFVAAPISDSQTGRTIGVVRSRTPVSYFNQIIQTEAQQLAQNIEGFGTEEYLAINDLGKVFIAPTPHTEYIGRDIQSIFPNAAARLKAADTVGSVEDFDRLEQEKYLVSYAPLRELEGVAELNWGAMVAQPTDQIFAGLRGLLFTFLLGTGLTVLLAAAIAAMLVNRALRPVMNATKAVGKLGQGQLDTRVPVTGEDELAVLGSNINLMADQLQTQLHQQQDIAERAHLFADTTLRIRQSLNFKDILNTAVKEVRKVLKADRVVIYGFESNWKGKILAESATAGWIQTLGAEIDDPCFRESYAKQYRDGRVRAIDNIYQAELTPCLIQQLEQFEVKAKLVAPVIKDNQLLGLLIAHQCAKPRVWQQSEIDLFTQLATQVGFALDQASLLEQVEKARQVAELGSQEQRQQKEALQLFADIGFRIRQSLSLQDIVQTTVREVRKLLKTDRVVVYHLDANGDGTVVAESVAPDLTQMMGVNINDPCFKQRHAKEYQQGRVRAINNIDTEPGLTDCHVMTLKQFEVKSNLVVPIMVNTQLFGLMIAHHCLEPRVWQQYEIDLFAQLATQVGIAIAQATLLEELEKARQQAEVISQEQREQKESLQRQLAEFLTYVEGASSGDLTVRAEVTAGEIGTVADFFNSIIESLRQLVTQVKKAARQVNISVGENAGAIRQLADEALQQAEEITRTLDSVEQMTLSIQAVAASANQAAEVARTAYDTAETGEAMMNRTVERILDLRETVAATANKVKLLGESSQQISKVVSLINQIALQTNVLAINASIEAAKAGEEGRGFAVVAEEVGQLATKSAAATKEIEQIVENIQIETSEVVKAMELGTTQVIEGAHFVEDTKKSLGQILEVSHQIYQLVQSISNATITQAETAQAVTNLMKEVTNVSEGTSEYSSQISNSLQRTVEVARQLQVSVGNFKIGDETISYVPGQRT